MEYLVFELFNWKSIQRFFIYSTYETFFPMSLLVTETLKLLVAIITFTKIRNRLDYQVVSK